MANTSTDHTADVLPAYSVHGPPTATRLRSTYVEDIEYVAEPHYCTYEDQAYHREQHVVAEQPLQWNDIELTPMLAPGTNTMLPPTNIKWRRHTPLTDESPLADHNATSNRNEQQRRLEQQRRPRWQGLSVRLPYFKQGSLVGRHSSAQIQAYAEGLAQCKDPTERWEQVPVGIQLMNEICDAVSIGSDFAFWSGLVIIVVTLIALTIWYLE